ncbi:MAG: hypothetical protein ABIQ95_03860 [Bdellovibrionia bacterium]
MRINLAMAAVLLSTTFSLAGTPDQDPIVKERRERFIQARIPTLEDLKLGKTWECIFYNSFPGNFDHVGPGPIFRFSEFDGLVSNEIKFPNSGHQFQLTSKAFIDLVTTRLPRNNYESVDSMIYIRVSQNGDLICESVFEDVSFLDSSPRSVSDKTKLATQYGVCPTNKIRD